MLYIDGIRFDSELCPRCQLMVADGSITRWIDQLQAGDLAAAQPLWERYFHLLVELARRKLGAKPRGADEEDVALSAFDSFCRGLKRGRFPHLQDRDNLWKLLVVLTGRKACHLMRDEQRLVVVHGFPTDVECTHTGAER